MTKVYRRPGESFLPTSQTSSNSQMEQTVFPDGDFAGLTSLPQTLPSQTHPYYPDSGKDITTMSTSDISSKDDERAPLSMRPKRAGRKLDTKEPESKRRAQNRAAQRAFRERKERHLQELELRIQELEQESATWRNSSILLRSKVSELEQQLSSRPSTGDATPTLSASLPSQNQHQPKTSQTTPNNTFQVPSPITSNKSTTNSPPVRNQSTGDIFESFATPSSTSSVTPAQAALGANPSSSEFCDELNLACVVPSTDHPSEFLPPASAAQAPTGIHKPGTGMPMVPEPAVKFHTGLPGTPYLLNEDLRKAQVPGGTALNDSYSNSNTALPPFTLDGNTMLNSHSNPSSETQTQFTSGVPNGSLMPEIDLLGEIQSQASQHPLGNQTAPTPLDAPKPAESKPQAGVEIEQQPVDKSLFDFSFQDNQSFDVFSFVNNDSTLFDGFDLDAVWNNDGIPGGNGSSSATAGANELLAAKQQNSKPVEKEGEKSAQKTNGPEIVPATREKYISCTEVWDRICSRPRFGEIDIQGMCMELRARAKCSDSGVVLPERDVDILLNSYK